VLLRPHSHRILQYLASHAAIRCWLSRRPDEVTALLIERMRDPALCNGSTAAYTGVIASAMGLCLFWAGQAS